MNIYLIDGTYELFRHYYALPSARDAEGREVAAVRSVLASLQGMIKAGATHVAVATDHVIESFRNGLWPGHKTSEGVEPDLLAQFPLLEETLATDRCPRLLGTFVKAPEVQYHHDVYNQFLWNLFSTNVHHGGAKTLRSLTEARQVSGHGFSRAVQAQNRPGFSSCVPRVLKNSAAKSRSFFYCYGTTEVMPCYESFS